MPRSSSTGSVWRTFLESATSGFLSRGWSCARPRASPRWSAAGRVTIGRGEGYEAFAARWPAFGDVHGEGRLLVPEGGESLADVIALPDADQTPEMLAGLCEGIEPQSQFARRLAESGCRVLIPVLIDRNDVVPSQVDAKLDPARRMRLANRELLYRSAFELGRHLIGHVWEPAPSYIKSLVSISLGEFREVR